jgi:hypothetical protein
MSRQTLFARSAQLAQPDLWAIGGYTVGDQRFELPMSDADLERDAATAAAALDALGIQGAAHVVSTGLFSEAHWFRPIEMAIHRRGGRYSPTEAWSFDAFRTATFARRFPITAIIGITKDVVDGLAASGSIAEQIGRVPFVLARMEAHQPLVDAGLRPYRLLTLGPALAVECRARSGAHVDDGAWDLTTRDGEVLVSTRGPRAHRVEAQPTGVAAEILRGACSCGLSSPRIWPA